MEWSQGYFTELGYTFGYYREMSPAILRLSCLSRGVEARIRHAPSYLELGFGQGVSINIHAAGSSGSYWGCDFNPAQTVEARRLSEASGANVQLFDESFEEFAARGDLPQFDIIALHGVWSWVSAANRATIKQIIRKRLRPGGIVYVSYNCLPGWAPIVPIRHLMSLYQRQSGDMSGPTQVIEAALQFTKEIADAGSMFFKQNPFAGHHLGDLVRQDPNYIAHEYLNADWHVDHFSDVAESLAEAKLTFVGSARPLDNIDAVQLSPEGQAHIAKFSNPLMRETVRDHLVNRRFRSDIFVKGPRKLSNVEQREAWHSQAFVLSVHADEIPKKITSGRGDIELPAALYDPLIEVFAADLMQIKRVGDLARHPKLSGIELPQLIESLVVLTGAGFLQPAEEPTDRVLNQCRALNRYIVQRARVSTDLCYLVSPLTGCAIGVPHMIQLFIQALDKGLEGADELASHVWGFLEEVGERLVKQGTKIESDSENIDELRILAERFLKTGLPTLQSLRIVEGPASTRINGLGMAK
ncbi:methyltransferase regulatory domain-containing protein [Rhizobium leguminosarum]|uniref:class I SAM-dependent methyltransferase n=1 Tax=Rhizobium leguminosarum TaxID=384 RepID=UPI003F986612